MYFMTYEFDEALIRIANHANKTASTMEITAFWVEIQIARFAGISL